MSPTHRRRQFLQTIGAAGAVLAGGVGTASAGRGARPGPTIVDLAASKDDFETLVAALDRAGLVDALDGRRQFTVFAPTDAAFAAFLDAAPSDSLTDIPVETLREAIPFDAPTD